MNIKNKRKMLLNSLENGDITEEEYLERLDDLTNREYNTFTNKLINFTNKELVL